jgi:hypothetical protein
MTPSESSSWTPKGSKIILAKKPTPSSTSKRSYLIAGEKNNGKKISQNRSKGKRNHCSEN